MPMNVLAEILCEHLNLDPSQITEPGFMIEQVGTMHVSIQWEGKVHMTIDEFRDLVAK
jgi:ribosomal protein L9